MEIREETWGFLQGIVQKKSLSSSENQSPIVLITHIPLYKPEGLCVDGPMTNFNDGFVNSQNFLSKRTSYYLSLCLNPVFVFNGHDHCGCKISHKIRIPSFNPKFNPNIAIPENLINAFSNSSSNFDHSSSHEYASSYDYINMFCSSSLSSLDELAPDWESLFENMFEYNTYPLDDSLSQEVYDEVLFTQEITVRSVMGDYNGASGVFSFNLGNPSFKSSKSILPGIISYKASTFIINNLFPGKSFEITLDSNNFGYHYQETVFVHHVFARIILSLNIITALSFFMIYSLKFLKSIRILFRPTSTYTTNNQPQKYK
ncbi:Protein TED1 [Smittium mucronatum]|uniref:Protein TED1 n=1 Tax=Smittium mucronatum TaxID=133383 RepID=A0A1R0H587_9FUNG|nr:Protein TED1 [Smittium mucronatum]